MERPTKVSLHSKRQQQRLLPRKHKAREEKETQCSGRLGHPAPDCAASRSSISNVAFLGAMMQLRGSPLTQRLLFWLDED